MLATADGGIITIVDIVGRAQVVGHGGWRSRHRAILREGLVVFTFSCKPPPKGRVRHNFGVSIVSTRNNDSPSNQISVLGAQTIQILI